MAEKTVATSRGQHLATAREGTRTQEHYLVPPVDIYDTPEGLVLLADLPGVTKEDLDVRVDNNVLTFQAKAAHAAPGEAIYREYELTNFFRQFELSEEVDQGKLSAQLKHGVLTLHLPRVEKTKPRRIDVQVS
jgi:HSP20 family molecular chaperone IbpA